MKEHQARETAKIEGSTNSGMLIRDIPKFDGNPGTFEISSYEGIVKSRCFSGTTKISLLVGVACADTRAAGRTRRTCPRTKRKQGVVHQCQNERIDVRRQSSAFLAGAAIFSNFEVVQKLEDTQV